MVGSWGSIRRTTEPDEKMHSARKPHLQKLIKANVVAHVLERQRQGDDCVFETSSVSAMSSSKAELFRDTLSGFTKKGEEESKTQTNLVDRDLRKKGPSSDA